MSNEIVRMVKVFSLLLSVNGDYTFLDLSTIVKHCPPLLFFLSILKKVIAKVRL